MSRRLRGYRSVSITMPSRVLYKVDQLVEETGLSRSEVITDLCMYCLGDDDIVNEIYPYEEEEE